jgi:hypothetical protein
MFGFGIQVCVSRLLRGSSMILKGVSPSPFQASHDTCHFEPAHFHLRVIMVKHTQWGTKTSTGHSICAYMDIIIFQMRITGTFGAGVLVSTCVSMGSNIKGLFQSSLALACFVITTESHV